MSKNILVIKHGALGDFILALPAFAAIRAYHAADHITLLTTKPFQEFAARSPYFDRIWIDDKPGPLDIADWLRLRRKLRRAAFARVYDLQTSQRSSFYHRLFWPGKPPEWSGIAPGCSHPDPTPVRNAVHSFDLRVAQLQAAGIEVDPAPDLGWLAEEGGFVLPSRSVLLVPGSAPHRPEKRWPVESYASLAQHCAAKNITPILIGTQAETGTAQTIKKSCPQAIDLTGQTSLFHIGALARQAIGAVGNDTGPMHLIAALGCPSLVLFSGHSNPVHSAPRGKAVRVLQADELTQLSVAVVEETLFEMATTSSSSRA